MIHVSFRKFKLDNRPLTSQWLFWLAIVVPVILFFFFGGFYWAGRNFHFNYEGFNEFLTISKPPLTLLAMIIPAVAMVSSMHRSTQTAKQIKYAEEKKNEDNESLLAEAAGECLKKAYELISSSEGKVIRGPALWRNAANLIDEFHKKKDRLSIPGIIERLEVEEDYWRAKYENLLDTLKEEHDIEEIGAQPAIIFLVAKFSVWRASRQDTAPYSTTKKEFVSILKKLEANQVIQNYLKQNEDVLVSQMVVMVSQPIKMLSPEEVEKEALQSADDSDPVLSRLKQQQKNLSKLKVTSFRLWRI